MRPNLVEFSSFLKENRLSWRKYLINPFHLGAESLKTSQNGIQPKIMFFKTSGYCRTLKKEEEMKKWKRNIL